MRNCASSQSSTKSGIHRVKVTPGMRVLPRNDQHRPRTRDSGFLSLTPQSVCRPWCDWIPMITAVICSKTLRWLFSSHTWSSIRAIVGDITRIIPPSIAFEIAWKTKLLPEPVPATTITSFLCTATSYISDSCRGFGATPNALCSLLASSSYECCTRLICSSSTLVHG